MNIVFGKMKLKLVSPIIMYKFSEIKRLPFAQ